MLSDHQPKLLFHIMILRYHYLNKCDYIMKCAVDCNHKYRSSSTIFMFIFSFLYSSIYNFFQFNHKNDIK